MRKPTAVVAAASLLLLAGCADLEDHPIERAQDSPAGMEYAPDTDYPPDTAGWDTLHPRVPPAPGVEEPSAGEPRTPAVPPGSTEPDGSGADPTAGDTG